MISKQAAQERLKAFYNPNHEAEQLVRLKKLSSDISTIGQLLIQAGPAWEKLQKEQRGRVRIRKEPLSQLVKLSSKNRLVLFSALFPGTASFVEETWNLFDRLPYQASYHRRPFRNPKQVIPESKVNWLQRLPHAVRGYEHQDVTWLAAWSSYLGYWGSDGLGYLFASAIDKGGKTGDEVFNILIASANGTHEIGVMGRHVVRGLLYSSRKDGWEYIEKLLIAAQREEGLRQVILEAIDEAHPGAFRRMLRIVLDHKLSRFSAMIRAFDIWFGLQFEAVNQTEVNKILEKVVQYLDTPAECEKALKENDAQNIYYALWSMAFDDVLSALPYAIELSHSPDVEKRFAAIHFLAQTGLKESFPELLCALDDEDLRISARVFVSLNRWEYGELLGESDLFEHLERLLPRIKHKQNNLKPLVWDWLPISLDREAVCATLIESLGTRSPNRLFPYIPIMNPGGRYQVARLLKESKQKVGETLQILLSLAGDASPSVREEAFKGLSGIALGEADVIKLESLLSRQSQDLRRGVIQVLLELPNKKLLETIHRLMYGKAGKQRLAALELLRECKQKERALEKVQEHAWEYRQQENVSEAESRLLDEILTESVEKYSLDDALGLMNPQNRTRPIPVKSRLFSKVKLVSPAAIACLKSLDALAEEHRNDVIEMENGNVTVIELLGNIGAGWMIYPPNPSRSADLFSFPLKDMSEAWWQTRQRDLKDEDGYELIRALLIITLFHPHWDFFSHVEKGVSKEIQKHFDVHLDFDLKYRGIIQSMIEWLIWAYPVDGETDFTLDALEESVARIPHSELTELKEMYYGGVKVRAVDRDKLTYLNLARWQRSFRLDSWENHHHTRLWNVVCWLNEPEPDLPGNYATLDDALFAFQAGAATRDDLFYIFMGPRKQDEYGARFDLLHQFSGRKIHTRVEQQFEKFPVIKEIVDACRERILDVECRRGELPTAATAPASSLRSIPGMRNLFRLLVALGDSGFDRGYGFGRSSDRSRVLSHLIRNSYPVESDSAEGFAEQVVKHHISETTLIELAVYAPQWVDFVQHAIRWDHLSDVVWWLYAHTKDRQWSVEQEIREEWAARISEHTPLTASDLMDGAVDVAWFRRVHNDIGEERWGKLYDAALYASGGVGHTRARLFADAMLGELNIEKEMERIKKKRHQDAVRALGLIPLQNKKHPNDEILRRYEVMQEFLRTGRKFGSQRKASEKLAVSIGMQNLARTAGYADPQRLEWAMEVEAIADLSSGAITVQVGEFQFRLSINDLGEPILETRKKDKPIKTIPTAIKKNEQVAELLERKSQLNRQVSRMRLSLEQAMCRGDEFNLAELKTFFRHPMLKVMIEQLIFVSANGLGYPVHSGHALYHFDGREIPLADTERVRIAHPLDLLDGGEWHEWQRECFIAERIQPFKQVFRELYLLTSAEKVDGNLSRRYAGQQVNGRQAAALFGGRGWVIDYNEGVRRTFHELDISARVGFLFDLGTPAEVEGSTIEAVVFTKRGEWKGLKLDEVPPRIFSEVMRDLDLVVSVAHAGGVDPESSASSVEARSALIRETSALLSLKNVKLSERHVIIDGKLSNYNVNLGSGVVHKQPGGALCIIPVHSQQRGRIFLPFVDNDPKTAEIVSKVIMLARDDQIKDPTILEQIL